MNRDQAEFEIGRLNHEASSRKRDNMVFYEEKIGVKLLV